MILEYILSVAGTITQTMILFLMQDVLSLARTIMPGSDLMIGGGRRCRWCVCRKLSGLEVLTLLIQVVFSCIFTCWQVFTHEPFSETWELAKKPGVNRVNQGVYDWGPKSRIV